MSQDENPMSADRRQPEAVLLGDGILFPGHFAKGPFHVAGYLHINALLSPGREDDLACVLTAMVEKMQKAALQPEVLVGVPGNGNVLAQELVQLLSDTSPQPVDVVKTLRMRASVRLPPDHDLAGKRVLVVDDVATTGDTCLQLVQACQEAGALVVGVVVLVDRGRLQANDLLVEHYLPLISPSDSWWQVPGTVQCQLCLLGIPIDTTFESGRDYVARYGQPEPGTDTTQVRPRIDVESGN
jgi:orotate phosphoribosyltransferase